jgi:hypothetical protein
LWISRSPGAVSWFHALSFPIFPWFAFPLIGFVISRRIVSGIAMQDLPFLQVIGLVLIFLGATLSYAGIFRPGSSAISDYIAPLCLYPDSITLFYIQTRVGLMLFASLAVDLLAPVDHLFCHGQVSGAGCNGRPPRFFPGIGGCWMVSGRAQGMGSPRRKIQSGIGT